MFFGIYTVFSVVASAAAAQFIAFVFDISSGAGACAITAAAFAAAESFVFASIIGMRYYNRFSRALYAVSGVCLALLMYLFLASCAYVIPVVLTGDPPRKLGLALILLSCVLTFYGVVNARRIVLKTVAVSIRNLPDAWIGRKLVFVSDLHLGQVNGGRFARRVTDAINAQEPDLVCIGGDLFDGTTAPDLRELAAPIAGIKAAFGAYFIMGNHEEFGPGTVFADVLKKLGIELLLDRKIDLEGVQFIGVDYLSTAAPADFDKVLGRMHIDPRQPSILFKHEPRNLPVAQAHGISLQLSGHTHRGQIWPFRYITKRAYGAFYYGLHALGEMQVYTSSGVGTWGPPLKVGSAPEIVSLVLGRA